MLNNGKNNLGMTAPENNNKVVQSETEKFLTVFSNEIKKERKKQNISQEELAYFADVSVDTIRRYENGTIKNAGVGSAFKIATALKLSLDNLWAITNGTVETQKSVVRNALKTIESYINSK